jgi:hypothetical protein
MKLKDIWDKVVVGLITSFLLGGVYFIFDYSQRFFSLPEKVEQINQLHKQDSIKAIEYMIRIQKLEQRNILDSNYLEHDYRELQSIKTKLKIK